MYMYMYVCVYIYIYVFACTFYMYPFVRPSFAQFNMFSFSGFAMVDVRVLQSLCYNRDDLH